MLGRRSTAGVILMLGKLLSTSSNFRSLRVLCSMKLPPEPFNIPFAMSAVACVSRARSDIAADVRSSRCRCWERLTLNLLQMSKMSQSRGDIGKERDSECDKT